MKLETHAKIGIWVGIISLIIGMSFFTLHESQSLKYEYGRLFVDPQEMYDKLVSTGTADAFIEKHQYFYEEFDIRRDGSSRLELYSINNQTGNRLQLNINYDQDDDKIREYINCNYNHRYYEQMQNIMRESAVWSSAHEMYPAPFLPHLEGHAEDQFVKDFIKNTDCLDDPKIILDSHESIVGGLKLEPYPSKPLPSAILCGPGAIYIDGMCLVKD